MRSSLHISPLIEGQLVYQTSVARACGFWSVIWTVVLLPGGLALTGWFLGHRAMINGGQEDEREWVSVSRVLTACCCAMPPIRLLAGSLPEGFSRHVSPVFVPFLIVFGLVTGAAGFICSLVAARGSERWLAGIACLLAFAETLLLAFAGFQVP